MIGIPIIVVVVVLVIWVLTNVLRAQQDDSRTIRRTPMGPGAGRPQAQPVERGNASDIDRFLAEIDRLRQRGNASGEESAQGPAAQPKPAQPAPVPAASAPPKPRPQPSKPYPGTPRAKPAAQAKPAAAPAPRATVTPPPPPVTAPAAPPTSREADQAPPVLPVTSPVADPYKRVLSFAETSRQSTLPQLAGAAGAQSPSLRKPPVKGSTADVVQMLLKSRKNLTAAIIIGEILGKPKSQRR